MKMELNYGVKTAWNQLDEWQQKANQYTVILKHNGKQFTTEYFTGIGWEKEPSWEDVLSSLLMDKSCYDNASNFEDFCSELGYDPDSRKAEKIYKACKKISERLEKFLGNDLEKFQSELENY